MSYTNLSRDPEPSRPERSPVLPDGYRSGVITAITVLLGFSFLFLRSWAFELPGDWTVSSVMAGVLLAIAILLELVALWRALQLKDDDAAEYRLTLRWFLVSIIMLLVSLVTAAVSYALAPSS
jgi:multisubunit Na+/H+ antiporter MnhB subunit